MIGDYAYPQLARAIADEHLGVEYGGHDTFSLRDARWRSIVNSEV
jgi:hypothetical protein